MGWDNLGLCILEEFAHLSSIRGAIEPSDWITIKETSRFDWTAEEARLENPGADAFIPRDARRGITSGDVADAVSMALDGVPLKTIASTLGRCYLKVREAVAPHVERKGGRRPIAQESVERIAELSAAGMNTYDVAKAVGLSTATVERYKRKVKQLLEAA